MELKKSKRLKFTGLWIVMLSLFLGELFFYTWCRVNNVNLGYEVAQETEKKTKLIAYQENLKIELARLMTYKADWNFDQGRIEPKLTSMAKMVAARAAVEVADEAIQLHGGYGYMKEYEVERFYRDAKITEIYEGTREIQKNTIASAILGKMK